MVSVAFQGELGAYSELAVDALWPGSERVPCRSNADVIRAVAHQEVDAGVLPIENSVAGTVTDTLDALLDSDGVRITAETVISIDHCLLAIPGTSLAQVRRVESHPIALAQCRTFFDRHPGIEPRGVYDTAGAARDIAIAGDRSRAAIASAAAGGRYGLTILLEHVEERRDNRTRFIALSRSACMPAEAVSCRTSVAVTADDLSGLLHRLVASIGTACMRITRLDGGAPANVAPQRCVLEIAHRRDDAGVEGLLATIEAGCDSYRILGSFPLAPQGWP